MESMSAYNLATKLMAQHGLDVEGWRFEFDRAKRRFGCCKHRTKKITLSLSITELNSEEEVKDTILHEIAHALVGRKHGHDFVWRSKALEIGCNGNRCYTKEVNTPQSKYVAICVGCGTEHKRHKKPKDCSQSCGKCSGGKYNPKFKLNWENTVTKQQAIS